jgi:hypothetical protein
MDGCPRRGLFRVTHESTDPRETFHLICLAARLVPYAVDSLSGTLARPRFQKENILLSVRIALTLVTCLAIAGCQTAQMKLDPALSAVMPLSVEGANPRVWNSQISFGPWATSEVREGLTWGFGYRLLGVEARYATQPYRIVLSSGDTRLQGECITRALALSRKGLAVDPAFGMLPALSCGFTGAGDGTLRLKTTASNAEEGEIVFGTDRWTIRSVNNFAGSPISSAEPAGYEFGHEGQVVAAVETINHGRVWMSPALSREEQARVAVLATALLLYDPAETGE